MGDYILLYWAGCDPEFFACRGHVPEADFEAMLAREEVLFRKVPTGVQWCFKVVPMPRSEYGTQQHAWGRWVFDSADTRVDGCTHTLKILDAPARGAFPITVIERAK